MAIDWQRDGQNFSEGNDMSIATEIASIKADLASLRSVPEAPAPITDVSAIMNGLNDLAAHVADISARLGELTNFVGNPAELG
jgi:hypothetical protein